MRVYDIVATSLAAVVAIAILLSAVIVTGGLFILGWSVFSQLIITVYLRNSPWASNLSYQIKFFFSLSLFLSGKMLLNI